MSEKERQLRELKVSQLRDVEKELKEKKDKSLICFTDEREQWSYRRLLDLAKFLLVRGRGKMNKQELISNIIIKECWNYVEHGPQVHYEGNESLVMSDECEEMDESERRDDIFRCYQPLSAVDGVLTTYFD